MPDCFKTTSLLFKIFTSLIFNKISMFGIISHLCIFSFCMFGSATNHRTTERIVSVGTRSYGGIAALIKLTDKQVALLFVALRQAHIQLVLSLSPLFLSQLGNFRHQGVLQLEFSSAFGSFTSANAEKSVLFLSELSSFSHRAASFPL